MRAINLAPLASGRYLHLMRARAALRCRSHAAISAVELLDACDAAIEALGCRDADFDLDHIQPTGMLRDIVELQAAQQPSGLVGRERLVERAGRVGREIIE